MRIGFIGAGKVGFSLGKFFACGGIDVSGYYSLHRSSAEEAAEFTATKAFMSYEDLLKESDAIFLTVPDGEISKVFGELAKLGISEKTICHCSGAMTVAEAFPRLSDTGAFGYSIHPLFPVDSKLTSYRELTGAFFCIEGDGPGLALWKDLIESLGSSVRVISSENKARYHAACVFASNLVCGLIQESIEMLASCGFSENDAEKALSPLIKSNIEHIINDGPTAALTGPVERGDSATLKKHLDTFNAEESEIYRALSEKLVGMAMKKHPDRDYRTLTELLKRG